MPNDSGEVILRSPETGNMPPEPVNTPAPEQGAEGGDPKNLLAGKYKSAEELEKAYMELQKKLGEKPETPASSPDGAAPESDSEAASDEPYVVAGMDVTEFSKEFSASGKLSEASYSKLEAAGFPKDVVDAYIRGVMASNEQTQQTAPEDARGSENAAILSKLEGGVEAFNAAVEWAKVGMSKAEIDTFNRLMDNGDAATREWAVQGLMSRYTKAYGSEPTLVRGKGHTATAEVFRSTSEVVAAMRDPRYGKDPAYTREVAEKVSRSKVFGG